MLMHIFFFCLKLAPLCLWGYLVFVFFNKSPHFFGPWNLIALQLNITVVCQKTKTTEREVGRGSKAREDLSGRQLLESCLCRLSLFLSVSRSLSLIFMCTPQGCPLTLPARKLQIMKKNSVVTTTSSLQQTPPYYKVRDCACTHMRCLVFFPLSSNFSGFDIIGISYHLF